MAVPDATWATSDVIPADFLSELAAMAASYPTIDIAGGAGDHTLSAAEYRAPILPLTGVITGNRNVITPGDAGRAWIVRNDTTGAFTVTVKTSGGSGVVIPQGGRVLVLDDGTNVVAALVSGVTLTQTYATADATHAAFTSADLTGIASSTTGTVLAEPGAGYVQAEHQQNYRRIQDQHNLMRADLADLKQFVNSLVDALQAAKIVG